MTPHPLAGSHGQSSPEPPAPRLVVGDWSRQTAVTTAALNTIVAIGGMPTV